MASAITQIPDHFVTKFDTTWKNLVQQQDSRLRGTVSLDSFDGAKKRYNQLGTLTLNAVTGRAQETNTSDISMPSRWMNTGVYDVALLFDEWDETFLGEVSLPTSQVMQAAVMARHRLVDSTISTALGGTAYTGKDGTTATTLPSAQKVALNFVAPATTGSNSGLTLGKMIKARSILRNAEAIAPDEKIVMACSQQQIDDLLYGVDAVANTRYSDTKALQEGGVWDFMGFRFFLTQLLPYSGSAGSGTRKIYAYPQSALMFNDSGVKSYMDVRIDKSHALQIRLATRVGATRMEEKRVVEISCLE